MTNVVKVEASPLKIDFTQDQISLIKSQVARGASDDELNLFLYQCRRTGLDPLTRQIYFMKRKIGNEYRMTIQTSIDGFRVIAERSGNYGGQDEPIFITENNALVAKVPVYKFRNNIRYLAAVGVAYWDEYCPNPGQDFMWKKMPHTMLAKVAEALALRKAYPQDLSGLYTTEELEQSAIVTEEPNTAGGATMEIALLQTDVNLIQQEIENCTSITELSHLYNNKKNVFEGDVHLKLKLSQKKNQLKVHNFQAAQASQSTQTAQTA